MVISDSGRGDELYATLLKQCGIALGAGAYDEGVGIMHYLGGKFASLYIQGFDIHLFEGFADVGDFVVYDYFHRGVLLVSFSINMLSGPILNNRSAMLKLGMKPCFVLNTW